jgi:hypothetical protein
LDPDSNGSVDPGPESDYPSVSRKTKMTTKKKKMLRKIEKMASTSFKEVQAEIYV